MNNLSHSSHVVKEVEVFIEAKLSLKSVKCIEHAADLEQHQLQTPSEGREGGISTQAVPAGRFRKIAYCILEDITYTRFVSNFCLEDT